MYDFLLKIGAFILITITIMFIGMVLGFIGYNIVYHNNPPAIEVYRGNTVLEITYKDGIPIDSTVIFKSNK